MRAKLVRLVCDECGFKLVVRARREGEYCPKCVSEDEGIIGILWEGIK